MFCQWKKLFPPTYQKSVSLSSKNYNQMVLKLCFTSSYVSFMFVSATALKVMRNNVSRILSAVRFSDIDKGTAAKTF